VDTGCSPGRFLPQQFEVAGGRVLTVREATEDDVPGIVALYERLPTEDKHRRFFSVIDVTDAFIRGWVRRTRDHGLGLIAVEDDGDIGSRVVADAGYVVLPNGDADFALTVAPDRRGWLGPFLLDLLVREAADRGVPNLEADILTENRAMLALAHHRGYVTDGDTDYTVLHVIIGTGGRGPAWPPAPHGPKLLVEKPGGRWEGRANAVGAGLEVRVCGFTDRCPALHGRPCPLAADADAIIVAFPRGDARGQQLVQAHRQLHGTVPVVAPSGPGEQASGCRLLSGTAAARLPDQLSRALADLDD
jgi:hypothetical protein